MARELGTLAPGEASAEIERRLGGQLRRSGRRFGAEQRVDDYRAEPMRRQIAVPRRHARLARPDHVIAVRLVEAEMRIGLRQARQMVAVEAEHRRRAALFE